MSTGQSLVLGGLLLVAMFWALPGHSEARFPGKTWHSAPWMIRRLFRRGGGEVNRVAAAVQVWGWIIVATGTLHLTGHFSGTIGVIALAINLAAMVAVVVTGLLH